MGSATGAVALSDGAGDAGGPPNGFAFGGFPLSATVGGDGFEQERGPLGEGLIGVERVGWVIGDPLGEVVLELLLVGVCVQRAGNPGPCGSGTWAGYRGGQTDEDWEVVTADVGHSGPVADEVLDLKAGEDEVRARASVAVSECG